MGLRIYDLVMEVTRRCNVQCCHCLRGPAQRVDMSNEIILKALDGMDDIDTMAFSGGEPSLAVDRIQYIAEVLRTRKIGLNYFYVVTNGKRASRDLAETLLHLSWYCSSMCSSSNADAMGGLVISKDQYHRGLIDHRKAERLYGALSFYRPDDRTRPIENVISQGKAADWGYKDAEKDNLAIEVDDDGNVSCTEGTVYINALGDVIPGCDFSYATQKKIKIGSVLEKPLAEILKGQVKGFNT